MILKMLCSKVLLLCGFVVLLSACSDPTLYFTAKPKSNLQTKQTTKADTGSNYVYCLDCLYPTSGRFFTKGENNAQSK